jgi:hypothetical protein
MKFNDTSILLIFLFAIAAIFIKPAILYSESYISDSNFCGGQTVTMPVLLTDIRAVYYSEDDGWLLTITNPNGLLAQKMVSREDFLALLADFQNAPKSGTMHFCITPQGEPLKYRFMKKSTPYHIEEKDLNGKFIIITRKDDCELSIGKWVGGIIEKLSGGDWPAVFLKCNGNDYGKFFFELPDNYLYSYIKGLESSLEKVRNSNAVVAITRQTFWSDQLGAYHLFRSKQELVSFMAGYITVSIPLIAKPLTNVPGQTTNLSNIGNLKQVGNIKIDDTFMVPPDAAGWIDIINDTISNNPDDTYTKGNRCIMQAGGIVKVIGFSKDSTKALIIYKSPEKDPAGTACPSGAITNISISEIFNYNERYNNYISDKNTIKDMVKKIVNDYRSGINASIKVGGIKVGKEFAVPDVGWVNIVNVEPLPYYGDIEFGSNCIMAKEGKLKVIGFTDDSLRALLEYMPEELTVGSLCPKGALLFLTIDKIVHLCDVTRGDDIHPYSGLHSLTY